MNDTYGFTGEEWATIKGALESVLYDTDEDPQDFSEGASEHLRGIIRRIKVDSRRSPVWVDD